jgi:hypothetical protein
VPLSGLAVFPDLERHVTFVTLLACNAVPNSGSFITDCDFRHAESGDERSSQGPFDDSLLSNRPCLKREYKIQETAVDKETGVPCVRVDDQKRNKQHSISHIVENRVLFTGRLVKTV